MIDPEKIESIFPVIKNRNNFLIGEFPTYHPESLDYLEFWKSIKKRCIEGMWAKDGEYYRYCTGNLFFYANLGTILHKPKHLSKTAPKIKIRPDLRDFEWAFAYNWICARGFSGFELDDEYTCCEDVNLHTGKYDASCFNSKGELKKYIPQLQYIRKLWEGPKGKPLYKNEAKNLMLLGARGGGKSWFTAVAIILHEFLFDGAREYTDETIKYPGSAEIFVGSGLAGKSSELLAKVQLAFENLPGQYIYSDGKIKPSPLYKHTSGSLKPNNLNSPFRHEYKKKIGNDWKLYGTKSKILHGVFTMENPEVAAGNRPGTIVIEEVALTPNITAIHGSNTAAQLVDSTKFGSSLYIGTAGNIYKIIESEIIFKDPHSFDMLSFTNDDNTETCWFVPAYFTNNDFKDENGNTKQEEAYNYYVERRNKLKKDKINKSALDYEMLNYPLIYTEMFVRSGDNRFPISELRHTYSILSTRKDILDSSIKGFFEIDEKGNVYYKQEDVEPVREFPFRGNENINGCGEMFEPVVKNANGDVPLYTYIGGFDPVDDDGNYNYKNSLQSFFVFNTITRRIVFEYTGRTRLAEEFYEQVRRAALYYNAVVCYENQKKGFYGYMTKMNSLHLLADTPEILKDNGLISSIGMIGNKSKGIHSNIRTNSWGIDLQISWMLEQAYNKEEGIRNVDLIRSVGYIKECLLYAPPNSDKRVNTDRISSMNMLMIFAEEINKITTNLRNPDKKSEIDIFKQHYDKAFGKKRSKINLYRL